MANPNSPLNGQNNGVDLVVNAAGVAGLKRGYGLEDVPTATNDALHQGVAIIPAAVGGVDVDAAAALAASLPAVASKTNYLCGFSVGGLGATGATQVEVTITGLVIGTLRRRVVIPAGVTTPITPIFETFPNPIPASAANIAIAIAVPSFGTGNTDATCAIWGWVSA